MDLKNKNKDIMKYTDTINNNSYIKNNKCKRYYHFKNIFQDKELLLIENPHHQNKQCFPIYEEKYMDIGFNTNHEKNEN